MERELKKHIFGSAVVAVALLIIILFFGIFIYGIAPMTSTQQNNYYNTFAYFIIILIAIAMAFGTIAWFFVFHNESGREEFTRVVGKSSDKTVFIITLIGALIVIIWVFLDIIGIL